MLRLLEEEPHDREPVRVTEGFEEHVHARSLAASRRETKREPAQIDHRESRMLGSMRSIFRRRRTTLLQTDPAAPVNILGLFPEEMHRALPERFPEPFRARQLLTWVHARGCTRFDAMTDLPRPFREEATRRYEVGEMTLDKRIVSSEGDATKYLWKLRDGKRIESVHLVLPTRHTFCISSQVGCAYGCTFCATARMGFIRHLSAAEIFEQVYRMREELRASGELPTFNVVFMGMGEPLHNYAAVVDAVRRMMHPLGLNLSDRRITISTSGLAARIRRLATEGLRVGLAVSLNATTDELRLKTMPITRKYPIAEILDAAGEYARKSRRRVTFEYVLLHGTNDGPEDLERLARISRTVPCKVNLIPWNPFPEGGHSRPHPEWVTSFAAGLMERCHAAVTVRRTRGLDIAAACGQLATEG